MMIYTKTVKGDWRDDDSATGWRGIQTLKSMVSLDIY